MRDIDDAHTLIAQTADHLQQKIRLAPCERGCRLVKNHKAGAGGYGAGDGHNLTLCNRQAPNNGAGVKVYAQLAQHAPRSGKHLTAVDEPKSVDGLTPQKDILSDAEIGFQRQFLMHGANAQLARHNRTANAHRRTVDQYLAAVGGLGPAEDLDQCRLAGAVFAHQRVNFTGLQVKLNIAQRLNARKTLGNCDQL